MEQIWFTSDTHFNHKGALRFRPFFSSVEEMNEEMIRRWNVLVKKTDRVNHLGDVILGPASKAPELLSRLNGRIYLIRGNHDSVAESPRVRDRFEIIRDLHEVRIGEQKLVLCHYALRVWRNSHRGAWHLHGHSHGNLLACDGYLGIDVGVDSLAYAPVSFDEIRAKMAGRAFVPVDHHR